MTNAPISTPQFHPEYWARQCPDKPALIMIDSGESITYRDLARHANQAARVFRSLGIKPGDTIALMIENNILSSELFWAAKNSGIRYVAVSTHLNAADAEYVIQDCGAKLLISSCGLRDLALAAAAKLDDDVQLLMINGTTGRFQPYEQLRDQMDDSPVEGRRRGSSMLYSSGTTGRPKGVKTLLADVPPEDAPMRFHMMVAQYGWDQHTVMMCPGPFYHAGPGRFMMMVQRAGGTVLTNSKFDPLRTLEAITEYGATDGFFVPTMLRRMSRLPDDVKARLTPTTMRHAVHAAAPCPADLKRAMIGWWGPVIEELYGGTEAFGYAFISSEEWLAHPGSVGRPPANCQIKIVDADGNTLPPRTPGRIMMANGIKFEYHGQAAKNAVTHDDEGFASLGDVGFLDEDGYLYLTDRETHMIIAGGVNIYPQEAELVISGHPLVEDVAVVGVPHPDLGEEVKALIVPLAGHQPSEALARDIMQYCRDQLSPFKSPKIVEFVDSLPRNDVGKLVKRLLPDAQLQPQGFR